MSSRKLKGNYGKGIMCAVLCSVMWGFLPIYWDALSPIPSAVIILYRIVQVGILCLLAGWIIFGREVILEPLKDKKLVLKLVIAGLIVTANWSIYIWAVVSGFVIQTSIGYYIEPLMVCCFGIVFFRERLTGFKALAVAMALAGLAVMLIHFRTFPTIALSLAVTFATYAALKKKNSLNPIVSLFYETVFLIIPALVAVIVLETKHMGAFAVAQNYQIVLLMLAGLMTAVPLALFGAAAGRIPLITLGVTQYISPSIALMLGVFYFREGFDMVQFISFVIIWIGLIFFTAGEVREAGKLNR